MINHIGRCEPAEKGLQAELLWNDPGTGLEKEFVWNYSRGCCHMFGEKIWKRFLAHHDLDLVVRAHTCPQDGYEFYDMFKTLVTVFSARNYMAN